MKDREAKRRSAAIDALAAQLSQLRESVGTPSFRAMSGRSGAISHTTLHEAAQGNRLPSWETTVEFVKACGADPQDYRERWERSSRVVEESCAGHHRASSEAAAEATPARTLISAPIRSSGDQPAPSDDQPTPAAADGDPPAPSSPDGDAPTEWGRRRRYAVLGAGAAGLMVAGAAIALNLPGDEQESASSSASPSRTTPSAFSARSAGSREYVAADCKVKQTNPPFAPPLHRGDRAHYVKDITMEDCAHVPRGKTFRKVWRFRNSGTVTWTGYKLHRLDLPERRDQCQTIADVPVPTTRPGQSVDIATEVTAPDKPGFCFVRFKFTDQAGRVAFPAGRPVNFQVIVG